MALRYENVSFLLVILILILISPTDWIMIRSKIKIMIMILNGALLSAIRDMSLGSFASAGVGSLRWGREGAARWFGLKRTEVNVMMPT